MRQLNTNNNHGRYMSCCS